MRISYQDQPLESSDLLGRKGPSAGFVRPGLGNGDLYTLLRLGRSLLTSFLVERGQNGAALVVLGVIFVSYNHIAAFKERFLEEKFGQE